MAENIILTMVISLVTFTWVICLIFGPRIKEDKKRHKWEITFFITFVIVLFSTEIFSIHPQALWAFKYQEQIIIWIHLIVAIALLILAFAGGIYIFRARKRERREQVLLECREALRQTIDVLNMYNKRFGPPEDREKMTDRDWEEDFASFKDWVGSLGNKIHALLYYDPA